MSSTMFEESWQKFNIVHNLKISSKDDSDHQQASFALEKYFLKLRAENIRFEILWVIFDKHFWL